LRNVSEEQVIFMLVPLISSPHFLITYTPVSRLPIKPLGMPLPFANWPFYSGWPASRQKLKKDL